jgi:hypothetical protein
VGVSPVLPRMEESCSAEENPMFTTEAIAIMD